MPEEPARIAVLIDLTDREQHDAAILRAPLGGGIAGHRLGLTQSDHLDVFGAQPVGLAEDVIGIGLRPAP